jgi:hypothetical protein
MCDRLTKRNVFGIWQGIGWLGGWGFRALASNSLIYSLLAYFKGANEIASLSDVIFGIKF